MIAEVSPTFQAAWFGRGLGQTVGDVGKNPEPSDRCEGIGGVPGLKHDYEIYFR